MLGCCAQTLARGAGAQRTPGGRDVKIPRAERAAPQRNRRLGECERQLRKGGGKGVRRVGPGGEPVLGAKASNAVGHLAAIGLRGVGGARVKVAVLAREL